VRKTFLFKQQSLFPLNSSAIFYVLAFNLDSHPACQSHDETSSRSKDVILNALGLIQK
jgi:hypothetical protein